MNLYLNSFNFHKFSPEIRMNAHMKRNKAKYQLSLNPVDYKIHAVLLVIILAFTFIAYLPSLNNSFTHWDDPPYVYQNPTIQKFNKENVKTMLGSYHMGNYHPLTMLSLAVDYSIGGLNPKIYHITNLIFHLCNTVLVFVFIFLLFEKIELAAVTSTLFGVHTLHVESVAWISERKDVLFTFFFLASLIFYLRYLKDDKNKFYWISLLLFILADLSKGMAVSLSLTLIAIDWLKGRSFKDRKVILEKIPFLALSVFFGIVAVYAQHISTEDKGIAGYSIFTRIIFASYGFCQYLYKLVIPMELSAFYAYPEKGTIPYKFWVSLIIALLLTGAAFYSIKRSKEYLFCFLFFVFNIILVLQILPVGNAIMADRYAYVPSIGFFLALAIAADSIKAGKAFVFMPVIFYMLFIATLTFDRCKVWHDSISLWTDALKKDPSLPLAHNNRGGAFAELKEYQKALADYDYSIANSPKLEKPYSNRGIVRAVLKDYKGAKDDFDKAIETDPKSPGAYYHRGNVFMEMGDTVAAVRDYSKVLSIDPKHIGALNGRGLARRAVKDYKGAMEDFDKVIKIDPGYLEAYVNRALLKYVLGDVAGAEQDDEMAIKLDPSSAIPYLKSGDAKSFKKDYAGAIVDYDRVLQKYPDNTEALFKRGAAKINLNDFTGALEDFTKLIVLMPANYEAYHQRGIAKNKLKDHKGAIVDFNKVLELKPGYANGLFNRGVARQDLQETAGAISDYDSAIEKDPGLIEAYLRRGLLKSRQKDYQGAMADYDKAISINPDFAMAYSARAILKFNIRDKKGACADWGKAVELGDTYSREYYDKFCH
jgi:protein O-mannosyl-transferase